MMNWIKGFALVTCLAMPLGAVTASAAFAETADSKPAASSDKAAPSKAQLGAYQTKCSKDADAKGLTLKKGKGEERKTFRADCIKKLVDGK